MKGQGAVALLLAAALLLCGCTSTKSTSSGTQVFTLEEMLGRMPPRDSLEARWVFSSLTLMGQDGVGEICNRLGAPGTGRTTQAENALQGLATYVVSQGSEADRLMFVSALGKALDNRCRPGRHRLLLPACSSPAEVNRSLSCPDSWQMNGSASPRRRPWWQSGKVQERLSSRRYPEHKDIAG